MQITLAGLIAAIGITLQSPREAARAVINLRTSTSTGWTALMLMAVVSTVLFSVTNMLFPVEMPPELTTIIGNPLRLVMVQTAMMMLGAVLIHSVGKRFGGSGDMTATLAVISWYEAISILLNAAYLVALLILPLVAAVVGAAGMVLSIWLLAQFVAELHGFTSAWKVLGAIFATLFVLAFALAFLFAILGVVAHV